MSLFTSIQMAGNALQANEIALQVVGQNIANANTPGYIREETLLQPAATQREGNLLLGLGVQVQGVVQKIDQFLQERLRSAVSDSANSDALQQTYSQLENILGQLNDSNLSTSMNTFFSSINDVLNQPQDVTTRNLAVLQGEALTQDIARMDQNVTDLRDSVNDRVANMAGSINQLVEQVRTLNVRIATMESGHQSASDAVGLRDQRESALESLAQLIDIRVSEQADGEVNVYTGADYLVYGGTSQQLSVVQESDRGMGIADVRVANTDASLNPASGQLHGLLDARDKVLGGFLDGLDQLAGTLATEFNRVYAGGQGLTGYQDLTSQTPVDDPSHALNAAGLPVPPQSGSFQILVRNKTTGLTQTTDINVTLNGLGHDTTLSSLATSIDAVNGVSATVNDQGLLEISSDATDTEFAFGTDSSGTLASLGLNTFFTGTSARDLDVNEVLKVDPSKFAASRGGIGADTANAVDLAAFLDRPLASRDGGTISQLYDTLANDTTQGASQATAAADASASFEGSLRAQSTSISGVNLDEEAVQMIQYQRAYQASAKFIATLSQLFDVLVNI